MCENDIFMGNVFWYNFTLYNIMQHLFGSYEFKKFKSGFVNHDYKHTIYFIKYFGFNHVVLDQDKSY